MTRLITLAATAALTLGVAACGSSYSTSSSAAGAAGAATSSSSSSPATGGGYGAAPASSSSASAPATGAGTAGTVAVAADPSGQLKFSTTSLTAKAGTVHIAFTNKSSLGHNLTLVKSGGGGEVAATPTFSGETKTLSVKLAPGTYTYYCSVPGHRMAGMQGTLTVQ